MFEPLITKLTFKTLTLTLTLVGILRLKDNFKAVDSVSLFETKMYLSEMHSGHSGGKTSLFKRCLFLKCIRAVNVVDILMAAVETRPSPLCYLYLLQGGGAAGDVAANATTFGCSD